MCGIIGYVGFRNATPLLIEGLKKLEYRGYDSAGLCVISDKLNIVKKKGRIEELEKENLNFQGNLGISHTRWATHGEPNEINAHPHLDCTKSIAIVHNGIIENYKTLKEILEKENHKFVSETDSEVLAHLIEKFSETNDFEKAVVKSLELVEGTFGLAILKSKENRIIAARRGSPLIIGIGNGEMFVTSDASAILNYTKKVVYLRDNEIASLTKDNYTIRNLEGSPVDSKIHEIKWTIDQLERKGFKHFMLKEIFEQPEAIKNSLRGRLRDGIKLSINLNFDEINRIIITACGTSWHSALIGKHIIEKIAGIPVEVDYASEFRYRDPILSDKDLVILISQSGETADTLAALREAKKKGAKTLGIVNVVGSSIAREVDSGIYLHAGPEIGVASTKAFTCQIIVLLLLALYIKQLKNNFETKLLDEIRNTPLIIKSVLQDSAKIRELAEKFKNNKNFLYLGRGINFPVALEGALKLKEISYIHAEGYPAAEMKHGPIALIDEDMPVLFLAPKDQTYEKILSNMQEVKARKGKIIALVTEEDPRIRELTENIIKVPKVSEELSPVVNVIPLQLFAYHLADLKGLDVDKPRNLAKSVTVE
ncbi:MAG: glutamine--fructose-6-phosphate transaminase (isomerizing) [Candidatus Pacearchaeota archaeon]